MPRQNVVIIGGGIMGGDIAIIFTAGGWNVHVMSPSQKTRDALPARIDSGLRKLGAPAANAANVKTYAKVGDIAWKDVDLVVEAATEDLPLKQKIFSELDVRLAESSMLTRASMAGVRSSKERLPSPGWTCRPTSRRRALTLWSADPG